MRRKRLVLSSRKFWANCAEGTRPHSLQLEQEVEVLLAVLLEVLLEMVDAVKGLGEVECSYASALEAMISPSQVCSFAPQMPSLA